MEHFAWNLRMYVFICIYYKANTCQGCQLRFWGFRMTLGLGLGLQTFLGKSQVYDPSNNPDHPRLFMVTHSQDAFPNTRYWPEYMMLLLPRNHFWEIIMCNCQGLDNTHPNTLRSVLYHIWFTTLCTFCNEQSQGGEFLQVCVLELVSHKKGRKSGSTYGGLWRL